MADHHKHGDMNTDVQEKTFDTFIWIVSRSAIGIICLLIFLALVNG